MSSKNDVMQIVVFVSHLMKMFTNSLEYVFNSCSDLKSVENSKFQIEKILHMK